MSRMKNWFNSNLTRLAWWWLARQMDKSDAPGDFKHSVVCNVVMPIYDMQRAAISRGEDPVNDHAVRNRIGTRLVEYLFRLRKEREFAVRMESIGH